MTIDMDIIRQELFSQGAVLNGEGVISDIAATLMMRMWTATPGAGVYRTPEDGVYRLELDAQYRDFTAYQFRTGLPMYDKRVDYIRHEFDAAKNRVMVYFRVIE